MSTGDHAEPFDEFEIVGEPRLVELRAALPPVILGQAGNPFTGHRAREQTRAHRRVDDHADPLALGEGQDRSLHAAIDERIRRLKRLDWSDLLDPLHLSDFEIRHTDVPNESALLQLSEGRPSLFDVRLRIWPVDLIEVDRVDPEAFETRIDLAQDRVPLQLVHDPAAASVEQRCLREHVRVVLASGKRPADDFLGVPEAVDRGRVDPIDAELERPLDCGQ